MFKIQPKGLIPFLSVLLLVTVMPSAMAGKPTPTLNGSLCKAWGANWTSGKNTECYVPGNAVVASFDSLVIKSGTTLILNKDILVRGVLTNEGRIQINGNITLTLVNASSRLNNNTATSNIINYGSLAVGPGALFQNLNSSFYFNYGKLINNGRFDNQSQVINGYTSFAGTIDNFGLVTNVGTIANDNGIIINNSGGTITNDGSLVNSISGTIANKGTIDGTAQITGPGKVLYTCGSNGNRAGGGTGVCQIGDFGPGGGNIFYYNAFGFACGQTLTSTCLFLEAAPTSGSNSWTDTLFEWSGNTSEPTSGTDTVIGTGYANTLAMSAQSSGGDMTGKAGTISRAYRGPNNLSDWFLPSEDELNQMCKWARGQAWVSDATVCNDAGNLNSGLGAAGFVSNNYWSSSQYPDFPNYADERSFQDGSRNSSFEKKTPNYVRPVRAF